MTARDTIWLVRNPASGSNDDAAIDAVCDCFAQRGLAIGRIVTFPDDDLLTAVDLERAGVATVAVFTGDGTLNAQVTRLYGWSGQVLPLPGGTMNLLSKRLHGDVAVEAILDAVAAGAARRTRPIVARCDQGDALCGVLAGPATQWGEVREALRDHDVEQIAGSLVEAVAQSHWGNMACCAEPRIGRAEGYPLFTLQPHAEGLAIRAYHAESVGELAQQWMALLKRDFREGPHDDFGSFPAVTLASVEPGPLELLIDGEAESAPRTARFEAARCGVDLLATRDV